MTAVVADTHALIWYLLNDPRLSRRAVAAFDDATAANQPIYLPTICLVEATYLVEKKRIPKTAFALLEQIVSSRHPTVRPFDLTLKVARTLREIPRSSVPDLPDRVIAATALALGLPLVTRDGKIRASTIETIW